MGTLTFFEHARAEMARFEISLHVRQKVYMRMGGSPARVDPFFNFSFDSLSSERPIQVPR